MSTIWHIALEPIETRYTSQWLRTIPALINERGGSVRTILGKTASGKVSDGAFLDFASTNMWKNEQLNEISMLISAGEVKSGDHFLFTDAWNTAILQLKYMTGLMGLDVTIHGMWHAGSYDPNDFLGRAFPHHLPDGTRSWAGNTELALFNAIDHNYFATEYHYKLFEASARKEQNVWRRSGDDLPDNVTISGQPHREIVDLLTPYINTPKENIILFPHRLAPEKQVDTFKELAKLMPTYKFIVCQEQELTKDQYHELMGKAKMVFSANLQETLGISCMEAVLAGAMPFVPDRLSYTEMYYEVFKYPAELTSEYKSASASAAKLKPLIEKMLADYDTGLMTNSLHHQRDMLIESYLHCEPMLNRLLDKYVC